MTLANGAISYEKIETDQDNQFIGLQLKQSIGTTTARLVTDLITTTPPQNGQRAQITSITTTDGELNVNTTRDIEQAITISEISGTKYITGMTAAGTVMSVNQITDSNSTKKYTTTTQRRHLGHLTSDDDGITSITTGDGTNLDTEDAVKRWIPDQRQRRHNGIHYGRRRRNRRQPLPHPQHAATQQRHMRQHRSVRDDMLGGEIGRTPPRSRLRPFGSNRATKSSQSMRTATTTKFRMAPRTKVLQTGGNGVYASHPCKSRSSASALA